MGHEAVAGGAAGGAAPYAKPLPAVSEDGAAFWAALRRHELRLQHCPACDRYQFPPRVLCSHCGVRGVAWRPARGTGTVYTFTIIHRPPEPAFAADVPYVVAMVELDEGPHMLTNITGCPVDAVRIGMRVAAWFDDVTDAVTLVKFRPVAGTGGSGG